MPKDKTKNHKKILDAAFTEFQTYGFKDASMRRIAAACDMSVSGLYKHFASKEAMFAALVSPVYEGMLARYNQIMEGEFQQLPESTVDTLWENSPGILWLIRYIYANYAVFQLLVNHSAGTRYENYIHELALLEEQTTRDYFEKMKQQGMPLSEISNLELHVLTTSAIQSIFQVVSHNMTEEEAIRFAKHYDIYTTAGWKSLLGLSEEPKS